MRYRIARIHVPVSQDEAAGHTIPGERIVQLLGEPHKSTGHEGFTLLALVEGDDPPHT